jgi:predicted AAA+ superfamily ATPase
MSRLVSRQLQRAVLAALGDTRVVAVNGARQVGKSTLVHAVMESQRHGEERTLDDGTTLAAARADPRRFVQHDGLLAIDEVQRAPELMLAIKAAVDRERRPGQYLVTGSARVLGLKALPDALVGRMETLELWPFSQGEIDGLPDGFVDAIFEDQVRFAGVGQTPRDELVERVTRGGFPEATRRDEGRRAKFFAAYAHDLVERDVSQLADLRKRESLHLLLRAVAHLPAQFLKVDRLASDSQVPASSVERYLALFEEVFFLKRIPAWSNASTERAVHLRKVLFVDTGLCAHLQGRTVKRLLRDDAAFGPLLENFVIAELARQLSWAATPAALSHYRTRDGYEVDAVLEADDGRVVGVEVKAAETVRLEDFKGLKHLSARARGRFHQGIVLYAGDRVLPFADRLLAVPIDALWRTRAP